MRINKNFARLNFHDATIEAVRREEGEVTLLFDFALVTSSTVATNGSKTVLKDVRLTFQEVDKEDAVIWYDDVAPRPHPLPRHPISEVMNSTLEGGRYHFEGFSADREWSEWWIRAAGFRLTGVPQERC